MKGDEMRNGGHAFPCYTGNDTAETGMTLRDYFAGQALVGLILRGLSVQDMPANKKEYAEISYKFADAMLAEREKNETVTNS